MIAFFTTFTAYAALLLAVLIARRASVWRIGRAADTQGLAGILALPRRYLVDLHAVVTRKPESGRMHVAAAGGAVALAIVLAVVVLRQEGGGKVLVYLLRACALAMAAGAILDLLRRRRPAAREILSGGAWRRFPYWLMLTAGGLFLASFLPPQVSLLFTPGTATLAVSATLLAFGGLSGLTAARSFNGPLKHVVAGLVHLAAHPRPVRFSSCRPDSALAALDLDHAPLGTGEFKHMPWNRLLSFDACVECGRCQDACPAFAAGQPLNPKALIQDLALGMGGVSPASYRGIGHPGTPVTVEVTNGSIVGGAIDADTLWSCTTCRACVEACPMFIEHVDTVIDLRRYVTLEIGATPEPATEVLDNLRHTGTPGGRAAADRLLWCSDLAVPLLREHRICDVLLWCSEAAFDLRSRGTLRALVSVLRAADIDFAILGDEEADSGDTARRLGDEATFQTLAAKNIATLSRYRFNRIVTPNPHDYHVLLNEYPALGGHYEVLHHTSLLRDLLKQGRIPLARREHHLSATYHDPCYLARYNGETRAVREIVQHLGIRYREMERSALKARCCGGGGGAQLVDVPGKRRIADMRMEDIRATGAATAIVACPNCMAMLEGVTSPRPAVRDIVEVIADCLEDGRSVRG